MNMKGLITLLSIFVAGQVTSNSGKTELIQERKEEARENVEEMNRANAVTEEEQREEEREAVHPYERIDPKSKHNMFEEMESINKRPPSPDL